MRSRRRLDGLEAVERHARLMAEHFDDLGEKIRGILVVVDDENTALRLGRPSLGGSGSTGGRGSSGRSVTGPQRQRHDELAAPVRSPASHLHAAAVHQHELLDERESQPQALVIPFHGSSAALEAFEDTVESRGLDAEPVVLHDDPHGLGFLLGLQQDVSAGGRVFRGVVQQVGEDLSQAGLVPVEQDLLVGNLHLETVTGVVDERARLVERAFQYRGQIHAVLAQLEPAERDPRDFEQIVDEARQLLHLASHDGMHGLYGGRVVLGEPDDVDSAANRRQRISQLVRERREEFVLAAVGDAQRLLRLVAGNAERHEVADRAKKVDGLERELPRPRGPEGQCAEQLAARY